MKKSKPINESKNSKTHENKGIIKKLINQNTINEVHNISRPTRRIAGLLGFLSKAEVDSIFSHNPFEAVAPGTDVIELWRNSLEARQLLPTLDLNGFEVEPMPNEAAPLLETIKKRGMYRNYYERVADYQFGIVPISALLSPQWYADLDYVEELEGRIKKRMDLSSLLAFVMPEGSITEPIVRGNQVFFSSTRIDLNANPIPEVRDVGDGEREIVVRASSRPNYVQVAILNGRLVLVNGVHKVLALHRLGYEKIPCIYRPIHNLTEIGLNQQTSLLDEHTFNGPRPAMLLDLLANGVAVPLLMRSMHQIMRVSIGVEYFQVPPAGEG